MQIAILSDIHDHVWNLDVVLAAVQHCDVLICCGDLCSPFIIDQLARGFARPIHIVFGNNDADQFRMTAKLSRYPHVRLRGEFAEETWDGQQFAVQHFDAIARPLIQSGQYDVVCYGHNHRYAVERQGRTLAINPGAVMGAAFDAESRRVEVPSTFVVYDTAAKQAKGWRVHEGAAILYQP